jgi:hypothetical protein
MEATQDTYGRNVNAVHGQFEIFACCQPPPLDDAGVRKSRRCAATIDTKDDRDSSNKNNAE